jgi:large subunit ribosomal protein L24
MKIKTNDNVKILSGKDKGKSGKVIQVFKENNKAVVDGINIMKKNIRGNDKQKGQIIELSAPINISNIKLICPKCSKETRVGYKVLEAKGETEKRSKVRICKKCNEVIN